MREDMGGCRVQLTQQTFAEMPGNTEGVTTHCVMPLQTPGFPAQHTHPTEQTCGKDSTALILTRTMLHNGA